MRRAKNYNEFSLVTVNELARIMNVNKSYVSNLLYQFRVFGTNVGTHKKYLLKHVLNAVEEKIHVENAEAEKILSHILDKE